MTLQQLKITSYLMTVISNDEKNYKGIADKNFDLKNKEDLKILLKFLNDWKCRQFKKECHLDASKSLKRWYSIHFHNLPSPTQTLMDLSDKKIKQFSFLFDDLQNSYASTDKRGFRKNVGPVGAAKTLFALRRHVFPPWDNPIINELEKTKNGDGYVAYLFCVKAKINELSNDCKKRGIKLSDIPFLINRKHASIVKLVDEYFWLTITRKFDPDTLIKLMGNAS